MSDLNTSEARNALFFLSDEEWEFLLRLAMLEDRSPLGQLRHLVKARAGGRLKDLGDDRISPVVAEKDLPQIVRAQSVTVERVPQSSGAKAPRSTPDLPRR